MQLEPEELITYVCITNKIKMYFKHYYLQYRRQFDYGISSMEGKN